MADGGWRRWIAVQAVLTAAAIWWFAARSSSPSSHHAGNSLAARAAVEELTADKSALEASLVAANEASRVAGTELDALRAQAVSAQQPSQTQPPQQTPEQLAAIAELHSELERTKSAVAQAQLS